MKTPFLLLCLVPILLSCESEPHLIALPPGAGDYLFMMIPRQNFQSYVKLEKGDFEASFQVLKMNEKKEVTELQIYLRRPGSTPQPSTKAIVLDVE